jgi:hypothetical protein
MAELGSEFGELTARPLNTSPLDDHFLGNSDDR